MVDSYELRREVQLCLHRIVDPTRKNDKIRIERADHDAAVGGALTVQPHNVASPVQRQSLIRGSRLRFVPALTTDCHLRPMGFQTTPAGRIAPRKRRLLE